MDRYVVITPAKNEAKFISFTINSIIQQTIKPIKWIIVDDGSTDNTYELVKQSIHDYKWIKIVKNYSHDKRAPGGKVVNAFNFGLSLITEEFNYIVKLDADLKFDNDYFENLIKQFQINPKLGICGGYCINSLKNGSQKIDNTPEYHVRGATKMYKKRCFDDIGGLMPIFGWDGIDEMKAMKLGWQTRSFRDIQIFHLRPTGQETGTIRYAWRRGVLNYYMGYNPIYLILSSLNNFRNKPYIIFGLTLFAGYFYSMLTNGEQLNDKDLIKFIKNFQIKRISLLRFSSR
jgi:poly-beta-1,6-N-acetyl-D-glucosamine synthase